MKTFALATLIGSAVVYAAPEAERVPEMPGMGPFDDFGLFSGYVNIGDTSKMLHYVLVESQNSPSTDPLLVWFNGGPGCSSMLGFLQEHGPYAMDSGTDYFHPNEYSWNREANVLYIESPAGVGYSYCEGVKDCAFDDEKSGRDNLTALLNWYEKYPEYKQHDLYISGESYGGIYVPYLTWNIDQYNEAHAADDTVFKPNLKGFAVGNGVTNWKYDTQAGYIDMAYWHSLIDSKMHQQIQDLQCDFTGPYFTHTSDACMDILNEFAELTAQVNVYDIFGICWGIDPYPQLVQGGQKHKGVPLTDYTPWAKIPRKEGQNELPPCTWGSGLLDYMNADETKEALHIPDYVQAWDLCKSGIDYVIQPKGSQWIYEALAGKYKMLHYSGDVDGAVPTDGTQAWIATLGWETAEEWRAYMVDGQVAGYLESYEGGLTFGTVHGAGHMAPQFKPPQTYHLVFNWMLDRDI